MKIIEEIVNYLDIPKKKERLINSRSRMLELKSKMSSLTIHKTVATCVYNMGTIEFFQKNFASLSKEDKAYAEKEIAKLMTQQAYLEEDKLVQEYNSLLAEFIMEKRSADEYYQTIQIGLRNELLDQQLPEIYIYQGALNPDRKFKLARHIIGANSVEMFETPDQMPTIIYPSTLVESKRKLDKLYNKTSFRYLEQLTTDYSYDLENKDLGNVRILTR